MHISRYTCKYIHIHSNTYKSCTVCPRLCKEMPHPGQAMPLVCMYLYVFASIWSICVYEFADTCRYMQIHTDTCRYMHIHTYTRRLGYTCRMSLHRDWDHWHGITSEVHWGHCHVILGNHFTEAIDTGYYLTAPYRRAGPTTFYFRNSCENSKSSAMIVSPHFSPNRIFLDFYWSRFSIGCFPPINYHGFSYRAVQVAEYCLDFESSIMFFCRFSARFS